MSHPISSHLLVSIQLLGVTAACWPLGWVNAGSHAALPLVVLGIGLGLVTLYFNRPGNFSIYPELKPGYRLVTQGPYRVVRHPMYSSLAMMITGIALYNGHWLNYLGALAVVAVVVAKASREERYLLESSRAYADYASRTWRFLPLIL